MNQNRYYDGISPEEKARHEKMTLEELEAEIEAERKKCDKMKSWNDLKEE